MSRAAPAVAEARRADHPWLDLPPPPKAKPLQASRRAWSPYWIGPGFVVACVVLLTVVLLGIFVLFGHGRPPSSPGAQIARWASVTWCFPLVSALAGAVGAALFRPANRPERLAGVRLLRPVIFRVVTRGENVEALRGTVQAVRAAMTQVNLFPYTIEVVTEKHVEGLAGDDLVELVVPREYATPTGARFKARALQYALDASIASPTSWLFHLDEETHVTVEVLKGIAAAILEEETTGRLRVGQGAILYHRDLSSHPFLTLADAIRTGDDIGRFHLQHRLLNRPLFGMHGSFILVRNDVEKAIGFDLGPAGSITEDTWWALLLMARGGRTRWVDGYCVEQSTRSVMDFLKQRRRWFIGLLATSIKAPVKWTTRLTLGLSVATWAVGCLGVPIDVLAMFTGVRPPMPVFVAAWLTIGIYLALYYMGLELSLAYAGAGVLRRTSLAFLMLAMIPVWTTLESASVVYAIIKPERAFHVVKK